MGLDLTGAAEIMRLWSGTPLPHSTIGPEADFQLPTGLSAGKSYLRNISDPTLAVFPPAAGTANGQGVIVVPGGGGIFNAAEHEGTDVCRWLAGEGYTAFLLKYRVRPTAVDGEEFATFISDALAADGNPPPRAHLPESIDGLDDSDEHRSFRNSATDDGRRALTLARDVAPRYGVRPEAIGMLGFSAGAFLCVDVVLNPRGPQPAFVGAIYGGETHGAAVPADAPPLFAAVAQDDTVVRVVVRLYADWFDANRSSELHVFEEGRHGFGLIQQGKPVDTWSAMFLAWMRSQQNI